MRKNKLPTFILTRKTFRHMYTESVIKCKFCGAKIKNRYGPPEKCVCTWELEEGGVFFNSIERPA